MNFRVFTTLAELRDALASAVQLAASRALSPYIGVIGSPDDAAWILDRLASREPTSVAGFPEALDDEIRSRADLRLAGPEDLREPLDVVVVLGGMLELMPPWFGEARGILIAPGSVERSRQWKSQENIDDPRTWIFMLEEQWQLMDHEGAGSTE